MQVVRTVREALGPRAYDSSSPSPAGRQQVWGMDRGGGEEERVEVRSWGEDKVRTEKRPTSQTLPSSLPSDWVWLLQPGRV